MDSRVPAATFVFPGLLAGAFDKLVLSTDCVQAGAGPQLSEPVTGGQRRHATCQLEASQPRAHVLGEGSLSQGLRCGEQLRLETDWIVLICETTLAEYGWKLGG